MNATTVAVDPAKSGRAQIPCRHERSDAHFKMPDIRPQSIPALTCLGRRSLFCGMSPYTRC
jgi:hypothetical protein